MLSSFSLGYRLFDQKKGHNLILSFKMLDMLNILINLILNRRKTTLWKNFHFIFYITAFFCTKEFFSNSEIFNQKIQKTSPHNFHHQKHHSTCPSFHHSLSLLVVAGVRRLLPFAIQKKRESKRIIRRKNKNGFLKEEENEIHSPW